MLNDTQAEHIPGCNMVFYKWALVGINGFDPIFRQAGDDVDVCWRLQQAGWKIGFSPAGFVWHYRRSTVRDYLRQQRGYGAAEALLIRKHPEYFNSFGGSIWRGRIYTSSGLGVLVRPPMIYRGLFGSAGYQFLYGSEPAVTLMLATSMEYHVMVTLPLLVLSAVFHPLLPVAITSLALSAGVCVAAASQAILPRNKSRWWSRPLIALLFFVQPIVRGWARYQGRFSTLPVRLTRRQSLDSVALRDSRQPLSEIRYWAEPRIERLAWVGEILQRLDAQGWPNRSDVGWSDYDVEVYDARWSKLQLTTVAEEHPGRKQLLKCRLRPRWALRATVLFWMLTGLELLVVGLFARAYPTLPLVLLTLPVVVWLLHRKQRDLQSVIIVMLDALAKDWGLSRISVERPRRDAALSGWHTRTPVADPPSSPPQTVR
jgi:hypothetical protein